jgi:membrane fusion protein, multidrug efflux system
MSRPMGRRWRWALAVIVLVVLVVLGALLARTLMRGKAVAPAPRDAASSASAAATAIELAPTDIAVAGPAELVHALAVSGSLKAVQSAFVKAKVAAEIRELNVREGDRVAAGQLLGRLDATEYDWRLRQAEDQAQSAEAQLQIAERTLANNRALVDQGFISKNALDTSASSEAGARASLQAARAAAELARKAVRDTEIRAPIGGLVAQRLVQPGERVPVDTRLLEIVDLSRIELEAAVTPEDVLSVRVGQSARVIIEGMADPVSARVARINPGTQSGTRAVMTYLELAPHPGLRQGLFARAMIDLQRRNALVVPVSAVRFDRAQPYVLALEGGAAVDKPVTLGMRGDVLIDGRPEPAVEVTEGLAAGATVLRGSVGSLRAGTRLVLARGGAAAAAAPASAARP